MRASRIVKFLEVVLLCSASISPCLQRDPGCLQIVLRNKMAAARTSAALASLHEKANPSYRTELTFAAHGLELEPASKAAADRLLGLLPNEGDPNEAAWLDLVDLEECPSGGLWNNEMDTLFRLEYHLPRLLARAVLLSPEKMAQYIGHTQLFITPESDFTIHMQTVCRRQRRAFQDAVNGLSPGDKHWFETIIFDPKSCRAIDLPEQ